MDTSKKKRGPPFKPPAEKLVRRAVYMTPAQWAKAEALGGVRAVVAQAPPPKG